MLTPDQIKNLKPGDKLVHEIRFIEGGGDYIKCSFSPLFSRDKTSFLIDRAFLSLPSEIVNRQSSTVNKYDPTRLFKKGDKARVVELFGRRDATFALGELVTVTENECGVTFISVKDKNGCDGLIAWNFLELVTPVEELEPYFISEGAGIIEIWNKAREVVKTWYYDAVKAGVVALAAAEAECARLNEEWRKE